MRSSGGHGKAKIKPWPNGGVIHLGESFSPTLPFTCLCPKIRTCGPNTTRGWPVNEIFPVNSVGIVTARDNLTIHWTRQEIMDTVKDFAELDPETARENINWEKT